MSDCKNGRLPATRRQRHRLGFTGTAQPQLAQQRPVANQDRVNYIQPATEIRPERNIFRRVQLEQSAPVNTSVVNSKKETKPKSFIAVPPSHAVAYPNHSSSTREKTQSDEFTDWECRNSRLLPMGTGSRERRGNGTSSAKWPLRQTSRSSGKGKDGSYISGLPFF